MTPREEEITTRYNLENATPVRATGADESGIRPAGGERVCTLGLCVQMVAMLDFDGRGSVHFPILEDGRVYGCASWRTGHGREVSLWLDAPAPSLDAAALAMWWMLVDESDRLAKKPAPVSLATARNELDRVPLPDDAAFRRALTEIASGLAVVALIWLIWEVVR